MTALSPCVARLVRWGWGSGSVIVTVGETFELSVDHPQEFFVFFFAHSLSAMRHDLCIWVCLATSGFQRMPFSTWSVKTLKVTFWGVGRMSRIRFQSFSFEEKKENPSDEIRSCAGWKPNFASLGCYYKTSNQILKCRAQEFAEFLAASKFCCSLKVGTGNEK